MRLAASLPKGLFCVRTIVDFSEVRLQWIFAPNATETSSSTSSVEHSNDNIAKLAEVSEPAFQLTNQAELEGLPGSSNGESGQAKDKREQSRSRPVAIVARNVLDWQASIAVVGTPFVLCTAIRTSIIAPLITGQLAERPLRKQILLWRRKR